MTSDSLCLIVRRAEEVLRALRTNWGADVVRVDRKPGRANLVTDADARVQDYLVEHLEALGYGPVLLAEEGSSIGDDAGGGWIVDPIDGTTNYVHGYPASTVSIAWVSSGTVQLGLVYDPNLDEMFTATVGGGTLMNESRIGVSRVGMAADSLVAIGLPYDEARLPAVTMLGLELARKTHGFRVKGPASLDLCYVAAGRLDGYIEFDLFPWDFSAGALILREAGGIATDEMFAALPLSQSTVVASNRVLHPTLIEICQQSLGRPDDAGVYG